MQIDTLAPTVRAPSGSSSAKKKILLGEKHLKLRDKTEKDIYKQFKNWGFILTPAYDLALLQSTSMNTKFKIIFKTVGWENAWEINEPGSNLLTAKFLCTLQTTDSEVTFRLFGKDFSVTQNNFSEFLGFHAQCVVDVDTAIQDFDRTKFW